MTTDNLSPSLVAIEASLRRLDRQALLRSLQVGLSVEVLRAALAVVDLAATPELESLYGWRNGTSTFGSATLDDIHFFPGFYLLSIEDAAANYRAFVNDARWKTGWFPIFANGGGDFYVLDLHAPTTSPVRHFRIEKSEHPIEFSSLAALLKTLHRAFERGVFFVDPSGYLEMDDFGFAELAVELNPDVNWWQE